jgi:hypothetical protein
MSQSLVLAAGADSGAPRAGGRRQARNLSGGAFSADNDLDFARRSKANLMLLGSEQRLSDFVRALWPAFDEPVMFRRRDARLRLPPTSEPVGTMILQGVETLTDYEQRALQDWLSVRNGRTRVVTTVSSTLLPMVEARAFSDGLYYRLNTFCIDLRTQR